MMDEASKPVGKASKLIGKSSKPHVPNSKGKMDSAPQGKSTEKCIWYPITFSCTHTGRYVASSKRRIMWKFGSIFEVEPGCDEYEEHEVVLVWSVKSGKARLLWNGQDVSRLFPANSQQRRPMSTLEFAWRSGRGSTFRAIVHANPNGVKNQYEFFIDGASLSAMASRDESFRRRIKEAKLEASPLFNDAIPIEDDIPTRIDRAISLDFAGSCGEMSGNGVNEHEQRSRLVAAGFACKYDMKDELRSDLYSSTLDFLRDEVSSCVPVAEEMVSRAIINAFSEDHDSDTSNDSFALQCDGYLKPAEVEADVLGETFEWLKWSRDFIHFFDLYARKLEYMQKHVDLMVSHVRHDRLKVSVASQMMHRVAAILKLEVTRQPMADTVMFGNLNSLTTTRDLLDAMRPFGEVVYAAVSKDHEGFGFCRFAVCDTVQTVCESAENREIEINGRKPEIFELFNSPYSIERDQGILDPRDREDDYDCYDDMDYQRDCIDPSDDGIELTYNSSFRRSLNASSLRSSFGSSTSSYIYHPPSFKYSSSATPHVVPTIDVHDFPSGADCVAMTVHD